MTQSLTEAPTRTMTRVKRPPEERRAQFLDCAESLFLARGYEATTVNDIIDRAGLSKGAFYHYFDSKEALLDALAERIAAQAIREAQAVLDDPSLDALARLNGFLAQGRHWKAEQATRLRAVFTAILRSDNAVLHQRIVSASARAVTPVLTRIVEEGAAQRVFDPPAPAMVAEILLHLGNARMSASVEAMALAEAGDLDAGAAMLDRRIDDERRVIERLLGVAPDAIVLVEPGYIRDLLAALT